jgi:hypothetical protein
VVRQFLQLLLYHIYPSQRLVDRVLVCPPDGVASNILFGLWMDNDLMHHVRRC